MAPEVHCGVEDPHDLQDIAFDAKKDYVPPFGRDPAALKQVVAPPESPGAPKYLAESCPELLQIGRLLFLAPSMQGLVADGLKVGDGGFGELQGHRSPRAKARKSCSESIRTVSPACNWA